MLGLNEPDRPGARSHGQRPGADPAGAEPDTLEQAAVGDTGRGEEDVLATDEGPGGQDPVQVVPLVYSLLSLLGIARGQPGEDLPAKAAQRGRGDHALWRTAGAQQQIDAGVDLLLGTGGTPEGVIAAAALRCLGGEIFARLAPRNAEERQQAIDQGYDLNRILTTRALVGGEDIFFAATGVTDEVPG